jgi:hypothetical protein
MTSLVTRPRPAFSTRQPPRLVAAIALTALAINSVLIQTVASDNPVLKQGVRVAILSMVICTLAIRSTRVPVWLAFAIIASTVLLLARANADQLSIVFALVMALLLCQLTERTALKLAAIASVSALLLIFLLLWSGITVHQEIVLEKSGRTIRTRYAYGTDGVPFFYNIAMGAGVLTLMYVKRYFSRAVYAGALVAVLLIATRLYLTTDARGGYLAVLIFVAFSFIVPLVRVAWLYAFVPMFLIASTVWLAYVAGPELNERLSLRPSYYRRFLDSRDWFDFIISAPVKAATYPVDNSYIHLAVGAGLATLGLFLVLYVRAVFELMRTGRYDEIAFLVAAAAYCLSESLIVRVEVVWIIYAWYLLLRFGSASFRTSDRRSPPTSSNQSARIDPGF